MKLIKESVTLSSKGKKALKESFNKNSKKLNETWAGMDVIDDLVDRAKGYITGEDYSIESAIETAIDDGLIYTKDIIDLAEHYGYIDDSELIQKFYDDLYNDMYNELEDFEGDEEDGEELGESLKESANIVNMILKDIERAKTRLKGKRPTENFGQKEIMKLKDKYSDYKYGQYSNAYDLINEFENWCANYTGANESLQEVMVDIDEDDLLDLLMNRVRRWTDEKVSLDLYEQMYQSYIDLGWDLGGESVMVIVDNDWVNYCDVVGPGEENYDALLKLYQENGLGDVSVEDVGYSYIEAATEENGTTYLLCRW